MNFILKKFDKINLLSSHGFLLEVCSFRFPLPQTCWFKFRTFLFGMYRLATFVHGFVASVESVKHCPNQAKHKFPNKLPNILHQSVFIVSFPHHHGV